MAKFFLATNCYGFVAALVLVSKIADISFRIQPMVIADDGYDYEENNNYQKTTTAAVASLLKKLFSSYHKQAQIVRPLVVHMNILLIKVKSTIEKDGIFESVVALFIEWQDPRLQWDPYEYGNITTISLDPEQVGTPDIVMTNAADHLYAITRDHRFRVRLSNDGAMKYVPTGTSRTWCDLNLMTFPFDYQKCSLEFESWSLEKSSMIFDGFGKLVLDTSFISPSWTICQWEATTYEHTYFTGETFSRLRFDISVKRKSTFYIINLIFPCATLSFIQLSGFAISSTDSNADRIGFGTTNLLTLVVFQTIVTEEMVLFLSMPRTSDAVTALSKYIIGLILISAISIFESVLIEHLLVTDHVPPNKYLLLLFKPIPLLFRKMPPAKRIIECNRNEEEILDTKSKYVVFSENRKSSVILGNDSENGNTSPHQEAPAPVHINMENCSDNKPNEDEQQEKDNRSNTWLFQENEKRSGRSMVVTLAQPERNNELSDEDENSYDNHRKFPIHPPATIRNLKKFRLSQRRRQVSLYRNNLADKSSNCRLWKEVAYKLDVLAFVMCALFATLIPGFLFLPLIYFESENHPCSKNASNIIKGAYVGGYSTA